jgi:ribonuclease T2
MVVGRRGGGAAFGLLALALLAAVPTLSAAPATAAARRDVAGAFDFWVLVLSWSPSWCEAEGDSRGAAECARPFSFTVHGLWPQYTRGYPADCVTAQPGPSRRGEARALPLMPSLGLVRHEWRKHGTCSGLSGDDYFATVADLFARLRIPDAYRAPTVPRMVDPAAVEADFIAANRLPADAIAVTCDGRRLREVRICFDRDLKGPVACPEIDRGACRARSVFLPAVRGR